jgi:tRNA(Ile)-lysidine synthase
MAMDPIEQVRRTVRNYDMVTPGANVLVAVSGGPDSVFLLTALIRLKKKLGINGLAVCNLDHGLRGPESAADSGFVKALCRSRGLRLIQKRLNLRGRKPGKLSTEELAREERYAFFRAAAAQSSSDTVATGHTLDDQAETVIMRLIKGASLKGASGIPPVRHEAGIRFIRPLIELEKSGIEGYLSRHNIGYCFDKTNAEPVYFRNIVRCEIMPFLERYNPRLKRALFSFAEHLREDAEFIREAKSIVQRKAYSVQRKRGKIEIKLKDIVVQPRALQKEILRDALEGAGGEVKRLSFRHWKEMENLIRSKRTGSSLDLPGGIRITRDRSLLSLYRI